ncbi:MAG: arginine repressor [Anaerovibrio sp.]|uniref:arginine repressor n=1 Tax=Anaerovibrio sp. TaxID=1872532 RepID=UPI0025EDFBC4|nr:arginine repressor [Anaerovibrio sp.]MCR5175840.1 arginine repressor [Anaerovibrio sp.]
MKAHRQSKIRQIIENQVIETQEDLAAALRARDIEVTQATVSRDIKDMQLVKIPYGSGKYRYAYPIDSQTLHSEDRMQRLFKDMVKKIDYTENIVVIKTMPGAANSVCIALDNARWPEIIGTVAGDDTIIVVIKHSGMSEEIALKLEALSMGIK